MHAIYELKEMLCKELEKYGSKGELTAGSLDIVDKLAHTIKNLDKIIEAYEEEGGGSDRSYARGRGSNARRDSMGRYSNEGSYRSYRSYEGGGRGNRRYEGGYSGEDIVEQLEELMENAPDERTRQEIQKFVAKMQNMM